MASVKPLLPKGQGDFFFSMSRGASDFWSLTHHAALLRWPQLFVHEANVIRRNTNYSPGGGQAGCIYNEDQAKRVKYAYDKGHQVASHTWSHKDLNTLNWDQRVLSWNLVPSAEGLVHWNRSSQRVLALRRLVSFCILTDTPLKKIACLTEAIMKITGAYPAFVRPRT
jgi:hypothetical protein